MFNPISKTDIGDEIHYLLSCVCFKSNGKLFLKSYFYVNRNICKYTRLLFFTSTSEAAPIKLMKLLEF